MWQYLFFNNYEEFQALQNCSSPQPESALFWDQKQGFLPFKINNGYITIK